MGRCVKTLSDAPKAEVETLAAVLTAEQVADYFGIGRRTFYSMMARDEEIAARYKRGKAKVIGVIAQGLINKARGGEVIPPFLTGCVRRTYAAIFSFWAGVMPPMPMFGRSLL